MSAEIITPKANYCGGKGRCTRVSKMRNANMSHFISHLSTGGGVESNMQVPVDIPRMSNATLSARTDHAFRSSLYGTSHFSSESSTGSLRAQLYGEAMVSKQRFTQQFE